MSLDGRKSGLRTVTVGGVVSGLFECPLMRRLQINQPGVRHGSHQAYKAYKSMALMMVGAAKNQRTYPAMALKIAGPDIFLQLYVCRQLA